jgi:recombination protein RecA
LEEEEMGTKSQVKTALKAIEKQFGKGLLMALGEDQRERVAVIPSGSIALNKALGIGGIPQGRIIEVYGPESSGKTTLALHMIAEAQKLGRVAAFIDAEHALDTIYAARLGVQVEQLLVSQPDYGEQALAIAAALAPLEGIGLIVVDSVAALVPKSEIEGDMGDHHVGSHARLMSQAMRKLAGICNRYNTTILFINQIRHKIGVQFGSPETTTGGNALKFYASIRVDIRRIGAVKKGDEAVGNRVRMKVVKNKLAPPFRVAESEIRFGEGFDVALELLDAGLEAGLLKRSGAWYSWDDIRLGQGREGVREFLAQNPDIAQRLLITLTEPEAPVEQAKEVAEEKVAA